MLHVGVVGCGYWGPNLIRNFCQLPETRVLLVADLNQDRLRRMKDLYPSIQTTTDYTEITGHKEIDIIAVATPVRTHYHIAAEALSAGKHVFVEKPLASSVQEAEELIARACRHNRKLMVGHTFLYTGAVQKMKEIMESGELGEIYYISSQRLNLGLFQQDINVLWDLAPHDLSIILHLIGQEPVSVHAVGSAHINPAIEDVAMLTLTFHNNLMALIHTSWLDPDKVRKMTVVGSKKMLVYDDVQPAEKIRIYDKSVEKPPYYDSYAEFPYSYKYGDIMIPKLDGAEPIQTELRHFIDCINRDVQPLSDGKSGLDVIRIIEAAERSLRQSSTFTSIT